MNKQMNKRINENINYINKLKHKACESVLYILELEKQNTFIFEYETTRVQIFFSKCTKGGKCQDRCQCSQNETNHLMKLSKHFL